ncbi:MAG TPA: LLM class F420-dependent oxidoreductase [Mycobacteriales bacterium]|jgi:probable F420-dependent oxidoreductase|nr:LLM class F420-dependent oxidoreductase [Mycobacteriales bacterium]
MHLGLALFATDQTNDIRDVARAAEDGGFESLFVAEHTHIPTSRVTAYPMGGELPAEYSHTLDPFVSLAAAAAVTERLKLGTGICVVTERDPIVLAKSVASLDLISGGRFLFGVGAGWNAEEMADHGVAFDSRWDVMRDRVKLMQSLWTQHVASYDGEHAHLSPSWQWPKPVQDPMPVLIGGGGKRPMRHAVEYGTGWLPMPSQQKFSERLDQLAEIAAEAAKPVPSVTLHAVRPDAGVLAHYASLGVERAVLILPPAAEVLPVISGWAGLVCA